MFLTVCHRVKCAQIAWKTLQQSQGYNLKEVGQEISSINTEFLTFLHICITHMNANISFLYEVL